MTTSRLTRSAGAGLLGLSLLGAGATGCTTGSARSDYFASRSIIHPSSPGDGSLIAIDSGAARKSWPTSLTFTPTMDSGDLADVR